ncbi:MAG: pilus assembly PilX N-terminal domain-containing protein [Desulfobacterales bacterium]|uniref:Pilus assembly PilX N-terminal domain-containing protein n=1 Tax=Candidatus Desulfatibia vada TaxID=2841696 RepID=A0A8J6TMR5_9BACT|nr:pilus assembly PilX N-terminal domain-containing protein [Candidatus Desulfatibia vada]MBL6972009.1 pilus assembly PilX N-terminal domain-containing protein [Desulfobacterales bacterium]
MNSFLRHIQNEDGFVLVVALFVLILLTIMGISATNTSVIDIQISQNDKAYKIAFYNADSGIYATPKLISRTIDEGEELTAGSDLGSFTYSTRSDSSSFFRQVMGFDAWDSGMMDVGFTLGGNNVTVDVNRTGQQIMVGGGAEFAGGAEGIGVGSSGGVMLLYDMDSFGSGPYNARSNLGAIYRKVTGMQGGL